MYDKNNTFAKILSGEIKTPIIYENDYLLVIKDISPVKAIHYLAISKGEYENFTQFIEKASPKEKKGFWDGIDTVIRDAKLHKSGYRLIINQGKDSRQEIPHMHAHILGGEDIGPLISEPRADMI